VSLRPRVVGEQVDTSPASARTSRRVTPSQVDVPGRVRATANGRERLLWSSSCHHVSPRPASSLPCCQQTESLTTVRARGCTLYLRASAATRALCAVRHTLRVAGHRPTNPSPRALLRWRTLCDPTEQHPRHRFAQSLFFLHYTVHSSVPSFGAAGRLLGHRNTQRVHRRTVARLPAVGGPVLPSPQI